MGSTLIDRALADAFADEDRGLLTAADPDGWSPLTPIRAGEVGRTRTMADGADEFFRASSPGAPDVIGINLNTAVLPGGALVTVELPGQDPGVVSAVAIHPQAFIAWWPQTAETVTISVDDWAGLDEVLEPYSGVGDVDSLMQVRLYTGTGTFVRDWLVSAKEGAATLMRGAGQTAGVLVGRFIRRRARKMAAQRDDFITPYVRRLKGLEASALENMCPPLNAMTPPRDEVVVVVHGTMSSGHELAEAMHLASAGRSVPIVRFEHDTWHRLESNAQELAGLVRLAVRYKVHLVSHSRGGLVAARVTEILSSDSALKVGEFVSLGTPFSGTPMAAAADVATQGWNFTIGWISRAAGAPFGPMSFAVKALLGICLKLEVPEGLKVMLPSAGELPFIRERLAPESICIAGTAIEPGTYRGPLSSAAHEVFEDTSNDMVVATDSARPIGTRSLVVNSDHFSYLSNEEVKRILSEVAALVPEADHYPAGLATGGGTVSI